MACDPQVEVGVTLTGTALLNGLRDPHNETLWSAYVDRYRPLLVRTLTQSRVPPEDAEDLAQLALIEFAEAYRGGRYERDKGRLRSWLFGILKMHARNWRRREAARDARIADAVFDDVLEVAEGEDELAARWDEEWHRAVLRQAMAQVQSEVPAERWEAFRLFVLEEQSAAEVAQRLGTTAAAVYAAKRRVLERVRALEPMMADLF